VTIDPLISNTVRAIMNHRSPLLTDGGVLHERSALSVAARVRRGP